MGIAKLRPYKRQLDQQLKQITKNKAQQNLQVVVLHPAILTYSIVLTFWKGIQFRHSNDISTEHFSECPEGSRRLSACCCLGVSRHSLTSYFMLLRVKPLHLNHIILNSLPPSLPPWLLYSGRVICNALQSRRINGATQHAGSLFVFVLDTFPVETWENLPGQQSEPRLVQPSQPPVYWRSIRTSCWSASTVKYLYLSGTDQVK